MAEQFVELRTAQGILLTDQCRLANGFWSRLRGLLGRKEFKEPEALVLMPCNMVHTLGMRFPIDAVFVNAHGDVVHTVESLLPNRIAPRVAGAHAVIELPAGSIKNRGIAIGLTLRWNN